VSLHWKFDFLLKPISYTRFRKCIQRVQRSVLISSPDKKEARDFFFVKSELKGRMIKVTINDILYIEGAQNYIKIYLDSGYIMPYLTVYEIEQYLPAYRFSRIHQSYIVNNSRIKAVEHTRVTLDNNTNLPIGRNYKEAFLQKMNELLLKSKRQN
jgi:DNA-binding LytR/AlgR family response regulator